MRVPKIVGIMFVSLFVFSTASFAADADVQETLRQMQARIEALEKRAADQDAYISKQRVESASQQEKIVKYESQLSQFEEKLHRVPGETMPLMEGLELGAGGTMIVQGANNVNYNGDGHTLKDSRADGSYSADVTLGKEFKEVNGKAFSHLEAGQGSGLEDNLVLYILKLLSFAKSLG